MASLTQASDARGRTSVLAGPDHEGDPKVTARSAIGSAIRRSHYHVLGRLLSRLLWLLRVSEFATRGPFISSRHLSLADVAVSSGSPPSAIRLRLKFSKTDPFGTGCFVYLGRSGHDICPVSALLYYLSLRGDTAGPLFVWRDGSPLSPAQVNFYLRELLSRAGITGTYSSRSFRIGAATAAAAAGVPEHLIQTMGRWSSMAYLAYVRTSPEHIASIAPIL